MSKKVNTLRKYHDYVNDQIEMKTTRRHLIDWSVEGSVERMIDISEMVKGGVAVVLARITQPTLFEASSYSRFIGTVEQVRF